MNPSPTFCVLPFVAMHVSAPGGLRPCCMFDYQAITHEFRDFPSWREKGLDELKKNLISGVQDPRCGVCWQHEAAGAPSHRQRHNEIFHQDLVEILTDPDSTRPFRMLHLDFDNLCNLKCIMCTPMFSSSLQTEIWANRDRWEPFQPYMERPPAPWHEHELFDRLIEQMHSVQEIFITGGEPLMNPGTLRMLELVDLSNKTLTVTTNGTHVNSKILDLLSRAGQLHVMISLEGVGAQNDYVRSGSNWTQITENITKLQSLTNWKYDGIGVNHTLQITSAWTLPALITWCMEREIGMSINPLINPRHLHCAGMQDHWRDRLIADLTALTLHRSASDSKTLPWIHSTLHYLNHLRHDPAVTQRFLSYVAMLDSIRGTDFHSTFPPIV